MISYRELIVGLRELAIEPYTPVLTHATAAWVEEVRGGAKTVLTSLLSSFDSLMVPGFTSRPMIVPLEGPPQNALDYGEMAGFQHDAEIFTSVMPPDVEWGPLPAGLLTNEYAKRSDHPLLSFIGVGVDAALLAQTVDHPYDPIRVLKEMNGWVLMLGAGQEQNFSIHYAEMLSGRKQFIRWALCGQGVVECAHMPGCSRGFNEISVLLKNVTKQSRVGSTLIVAYPVAALLEIATDLIKGLPQALLCKDQACAFCRAVRAANA